MAPESNTSMGHAESAPVDVAVVALAEAIDERLQCIHGACKGAAALLSAMRDAVGNENAERTEERWQEIALLLDIAIATLPDIAEVAQIEDRLAEIVRLNPPLDGTADAV